MHVSFLSLLGGFFGNGLGIRADHILVSSGHGAAGGIGSAMARSFSAHGATLVLADRNQTGLDELATSVGGNPPCLGYDQSIPEEVEQLHLKYGRRMFIPTDQ